jgi:hypothetical protein
MAAAEQPNPPRGIHWGRFIALGSLGACGGGLLAFWLIYVRAPDPASVCSHLVQLTRAEAGESAPRAVDALVERLETRCVEDKARIMRMRDKLEYAKYARCVVAATTLSDAERC